MRGGASTSPSFVGFRLSSDPGPGPRGGSAVQVSAWRPPAVWVAACRADVGRVLEAQKSQAGARQGWEGKASAGRVLRSSVPGPT